MKFPKFLARYHLRSLQLKNKLILQHLHLGANALLLWGVRSLRSGVRFVRSYQSAFATGIVLVVLCLMFSADTGRKEPIGHDSDTSRSPIASYLINGDIGGSDLVCSPAEVTIDICSPVEGTIDNCNSDIDVSYIWYIESDHKEFPQRHDFEYPESGLYVITLIAENLCGYDTMSTLVDVSPMPEAHFTYTSTACVGESIMFTNESLGSDPSFCWMIDSDLESGLGDWYVNRGTWSIDDNFGYQSQSSAGTATNPRNVNYYEDVSSCLASPPFQLPDVLQTRLRSWHWYAFSLEHYSGVAFGQLQQTTFTQTGDWTRWQQFIEVASQIENTPYKAETLRSIAQATAHHDKIAVDNKVDANKISILGSPNRRNFLEHSDIVLLPIITAPKTPQQAAIPKWLVTLFCSVSILLLILTIWLLRKTLAAIRTFHPPKPRQGFAATLTEVIGMVKLAELEQALTRLETVLEERNQDILNQILLLQFQLHEVEREYRLSVISYEENSRVKNKIVLSTLELIAQLRSQPIAA